MGTLTKQIYRYTHPRSMRHNENLWPFVSIRRDDSGAIVDFRYRRQAVPLVNLRSLKQQFQGDILLTATGPSIKTIDFKGIPPIPAMGVNGAWHLRPQLAFKFYVIVDMTFIDRQHALLEAIIADRDVMLFTTAHGIVKIIDRFSLAAVKCRLALIEDACYRIYQPRIKDDDIAGHFARQPDILFSPTHPNIAFHQDICRGIFDAGTVVYWSLQIIRYLGFERVYIAGLDMNNFTSPRFYENNHNQLPSFLENKVEDIVFPGLALSRDAFAARQATIVNLSLQSAVPSSIFPKQGYQDVFK